MDIKMQGLIEVAKQHSDLEVIFMVNYEVIASDECNYWQCEISKILVDFYYCNDEKVYVGKYEITQQLEYDFADCEDSYNLTNEEFEEEVNQIYQKKLKSGDIAKKIIVYLDN